MVVGDETSRLGDPIGLSDDQLLEMYWLMTLARALDERMWVLNRAGRVPFVVTGRGHEGAQVAITWPLRRGHDWIAPYYRSIATCLTFGVSARDIMTAQYATANDPSSGGRQMPGHYGSRRHNLLSVSSPVATQLLHAVGIALAAKVWRTGQVAMAFMGEGSSNQGDVHEGLNFAAIHRLPFVLVVENNGYAISVPHVKECSVEDVAVRAAGYGIPGVVVDGTDVLACYAAAREAVDRARAGKGPTLIEAKVTRLTAHSSDDQETRYRTEQELLTERTRDPLPSFREQLQAAGVLTDERLRRVNAEIAAAVDDATSYAEAQPDPEPSTAMRWVYAEEWPSEAPPPWGFGPGEGARTGSWSIHGRSRRASGGWPRTEPDVVHAHLSGSKPGSLRPATLHPGNGLRAGSSNQPTRPRPPAPTLAGRPRDAAPTTARRPCMDRHPPDPSRRPETDVPARFAIVLLALLVLVPLFTIGALSGEPAGSAAGPDRAPAGTARRPDVAARLLAVPGAAANAAISGYRMPLADPRVIKRMEPDDDGPGLVGGVPTHLGVDLATRCGDRVVAAHDGTVIAAGRTEALAHLGFLDPSDAFLDSLASRPGTITISVVVDDGNGLVSVYAHFSTIVVRAGQHVGAGELLGFEGDSGGAPGCRLHYGLYRADGGQPIETNPAPWTDDVRPLLPPRMHEFVDPLAFLGGPARVMGD